MTDFFDAWDSKRNPAPAAPGPIPAARDATAYARAALAGEVDNILAVPIGSGRNHQLNISAMKMGQIVATGAIDEYTVTETLGAADGGLHYKATRDTIASGLKAGMAQGRIIPEPTHPERVEVPPWERSDDPFSDNYVAPPASPAAVTTGASSPPGDSPSATVDVASTPATPSTGGTTDEADQKARYDAAVALEAGRLRLQRDARARIDHEDALRQFRVPVWTATLTDELALPPEPVRYRVDKLIPIGGNVLLTAQFKAGKTTLITNFTRSAVDGEPFLGRYCIEPFDGRVGIFNYEVSRSQYAEWLRDVDIENTDKATTLPLRGYRLDLRVPHIETWVVEWLRDRDVRVWIVDPFAAAATGIDENSNTEVGAFLNTLDVIKERAGVSELILPVHTGRMEQEQGAERARGATRLDDWADVRWLLTKDNNDVRYFRATGRDVETDEAALAFDPATRRLTLTGGDRQSVQNNTYRDAVLTIIENKPGVSVTDLRVGVKQILKRASVGQITAAVEDLVYARKIHTKRAGHAIGHYIGAAEAAPADPFN